MLFCSTNITVTRVICGYSLCVNKKKDSGTVYQQHCRHLINMLGDDTCPWMQFLGGPSLTDEMMAASGRMSNIMFGCKQEYLSGRDGMGTHRSTWPGDERGHKGVHHKATQGDVLPGKCTD
jgi:hypothetical protein